MSLSPRAIEYLGALKQDPSFKRLLAEIEEKDVFCLTKLQRWSPENKLTPEERIYQDGLHYGRNEVLSLFK